MFSSPSNAVLRGMFATSNGTNSQFIVTISSTPVSIQVNFFRRSRSGQLELVQSVPLQQKKTNWSSFASGPNGSVFCAILYSTCVHEIFRSHGAAVTPFADSSTAHGLPAVVHYICGLQCVGEQRLVASFNDRSVRVFFASGGALTELQRIPWSAADGTPYTLVGLPNGGVCVKSDVNDPTTSIRKYNIDFCTVDANGTLSSPRRLEQFTNGIDVWCHLRLSEASDSSHRIILAEYDAKWNKTLALRMYLCQQD